MGIWQQEIHYPLNLPPHPSPHFPPIPMEANDRVIRGVPQVLKLLSEKYEVLVRERSIGTVLKLF